MAHLDNPKSKKFPHVVTPRLQKTRKASALSRQRLNSQHPLELLSRSVVQGQCCSWKYTRRRYRRCQPLFHSEAPTSLLQRCIKTTHRTSRLLLTLCKHSARKWKSLSPAEHTRHYTNCSLLTASTATFIKAHFTIKNLEFFATCMITTEQSLTMTSS